MRLKKSAMEKFRLIDEWFKTTECDVELLKDIYGFGKSRGTIEDFITEDEIDEDAEPPRVCEIHDMMAADKSCGEILLTCTEFFMSVLPDEDGDYDYECTYEDLQEVRRIFFAYFGFFMSNISSDEMQVIFPKFKEIITW
ncbi:MAG: hypothetical protein LUC85_00720 [Bacteroidales bacterium]|nr:hypothetical protein [Bacteroidales bacterium]